MHEARAAMLADEFVQSEIPVIVKDILERDSTLMQIEHY